MLRFSQLQNNTLIRLLNDIMFLFLHLVRLGLYLITTLTAKQHVALCYTTRMYIEYREMH